MSDKQDLKSKILSMRQKNFGEIINQSNEKNDNEKPLDSEIDKEGDKLNPHQNEININKVEQNDQFNKKSEAFDISEIKENLNKVAKTNEKAFNLLANKFNESVEVILELTQRVEKLETITRLQAMQKSSNKNIESSSPKGIKFFIFLLFVAGISYFLYNYNVDLSILKEISKYFLAIVGK